MKKAWALLAFILLFSVGALFIAFPPQTLSVSFLNVGQGDSILIQGPTGVTVLVDGGRGSVVLRELGGQLSFFKRSLDAVVETHSDADHIGGLIDVFDRYHIKNFIEPGISADTDVSTMLTEKVREEEGVTHIIARKGMRLILGGGAYADILYPDKDVSHVKNTNSGSVVLRVVYGDTSFMLTGDLPQKEELHVVFANPEDLSSDILKVGHHGSKTSSAEAFVHAVSPTYAVFSRGCTNSYGHPHKEVVELMAMLKISTFDTCTDGTVTFHSDGTAFSVR